MKKFRFISALFLGLCFTFVSCQKATETLEPETTTTQKLSFEQMIEELRHSNQGVLHETPPAGYHFSQEGKFKFGKAYVFELKDGKTVEYYGFDSQEQYDNLIKNSRAVDRAGNPTQPNLGCPNRGINCGIDGNGQVYFPYYLRLN